MASGGELVGTDGHSEGQERASRLHEVYYILGIRMRFHIVPSNMTGAVSEG